jgi:hypothetical protein
LERNHQSFNLDGGGNVEVAAEARRSRTERGVWKKEKPRDYSEAESRRAILVSLGKDRSLVLSPRAMLSHEPIEWPDEVEVLVDRLESESAKRKLTREERALMDVYETVPVLESQDGLHGFWQSGVNQQRVIASFEMIGATMLVDPMNASQWCETRAEDRNEYSETEEEYLTTIEEELFEGMDELVDLLLGFIEEELG